MNKINDRQNWRRCINCRLFAPKKSFWRVVRVYSSNQITIDEGMGRSAYICPTAECLSQAQKKKRLEKSLKTNIDDSIYQQLWQKIT